MRRKREDLAGWWTLEHDLVGQPGEAAPGKGGQMKSGKLSLKCQAGNCTGSRAESLPGLQ